MAQKGKTIEELIAETSNELEKLVLTNRFAFEISTQNPDKAEKLAKQAQGKALQLNNLQEAANALIVLSNVYRWQSNYDQCFKSGFEALEILKSINNNEGQARCLDILGSAYFSISNFEDALKCRLDSLKVYETINNERGKISSLMNIGNIHASIKNYDEALKYYEECIQLTKKNDDYSWLKTMYMNVGNVYALQGKFTKAYDFYGTSLNYAMKLKDHDDISLYNNLGEVLFNLYKYDEAERYYKKAYSLSKKTRFIEGLSNSSIGIAKLLNAQNKTEEALAYAREVEGESFGLPASNILAEAYLLISKIHEQKADLSNALKYYKKYYSVKKDFFKNESERKTKNMLLMHTVDELKKQAEMQRITNEELAKVNKELEKTSRSLLESISYARHIQDAILPSEKLLKHYFSDSFIFLRPKDIISGDFFWIFEKEDSVFVAAVDCTGHGVPGAFMSVVANSLLNQAASGKWISTPGLLLNEVSMLMERSLASKEDFVAKDGMDMSLCSINKSRKQMVFSGAHNSIVVISDNRVYQYKADKISIGNMVNINFTNTSIKLKKGDCVYLYTDGFVDQKGGPEKRKFYHEPFQQLLLDISKKSMDIQKEILEDKLLEWMGKESQLDDVLVMGIRM